MDSYIIFMELFFGTECTVHPVNRSAQKRTSSF